MAKKAACVKDDDDSFLTPAHPDRTRHGVVYTPPFAGSINEEALWPMKAFLEARCAAPRRLGGVFARTAAGTALGGFASQRAAGPLAKVRERGTPIVGIDQDTPPFHAGDNINDDLRNRVWKRHDFGYGSADVLMHGLVDRPLMDPNPQVSIFAPRARERVATARLLAQVSALDSMTQFGRLLMAVPDQSLAGWLAADGGRGRGLAEPAQHVMERRHRVRAHLVAR